MRKLEAKKNKGRYKSTSHWLDAVYRNNKEFIIQEYFKVKALGWVKSNRRNNYNNKRNNQ